MVSPYTPVTIPKIRAGHGRISLVSYGSSAVFSEFAATYPLKLLAPRITRSGVAVVYLLTYGGGLVGGDEVQLFVNVDAQTVLVMLSQGSTKVFKLRPGQRLAIAQSNSRYSDPGNEPPIEPGSTMQNMTYTISAGGALFLLPDPVTCFRSASYNQTQTFRLSKDSSIVILDWLTSGRMSMGEEWAFSRYYSANELWVDGKRIAKDVMLLDDQQVDPVSKAQPRTMNDRLAPYSCYAMIILYGPLVAATVMHLSSLYNQISVFKTKTPDDMLWSLSPMTSGQGAIVRVAGKETETVKRWLSQALLGLREIVGGDVYKRAFQE
ncbi:hypothetical protein H0H92_003532 [Tricholoma furcatifolium]|nr:hypothetical protein H0H92_003532 [Tricholoma furcatifolium]